VALFDKGKALSRVTEVQRPQAVAYVIYSPQNGAHADERNARSGINIKLQAKGIWYSAGFPGGSMDIPEGAEPGNASEREQESKLNEKQEEARKIRRLQVMISMVMSVISQDPDLTVEEASEMVANAKRAALAMFPDKEFAYDILYKPRLQRLMNERFRLQ
jgi:hypothetical protein